MKLQKESFYMGNNKFAFPADNIPQSQKETPDYFRHCANAIVFKYVSNRTSIPYNYGEGRYSIETLRDFMRGTNSSEPYINKLCGFPDPKTGKRKTTMNIDWSPPQILAQKMDVVKGYIMKLKYDVVTQAIDMQAKMDKELIEANLKLMIDDKFRLLGKEINEIIGRDVIQQDKNQQEVPFQSEKDVAMFSQIGGILLEQEIAIKTLLQETLMVSDYEGIQEKLVEDLLAAAWIGTKSYLEKGCEIPKRRWVDINRAIVPYSDYNDHRDISYAGEIRQMTIAEIRKESGLSESDIMKIAQTYARDHKSPQYMPDFYHNFSLGYRGDGFGMNMIDSLVVDVADVVWIGTHTDRITKVKRKKEGNIALNKVSDDYELTDSAKKQGKEVNNYSRQCLYKAKLVIGTDYVFDYGKEYNQTYRKNNEGKMEIMMPYRFVKTGSTSLVERCIGFYNDIAIATFKKRNAMKKIIPPPGLYFEKSAFENLTVGGTGVKVRENIGILSDSGYILGDTQNVWGQNVVGRSAITPIPSGSQEQIAIFNNDIEFNIRQIERVTGINDIFSGSTPSSETGLGVSQIAVNATTNAIYPIIKALETCHTQALRVEAKMWQISSSYLEDKNRTRKPHDRALGYVYIGKDISHREFLINIEAGVSEEEKLMLMQEIRQLQDVRRQAGSGGIRPSDYLMIYEMIKAGNIKQARLVLAQVEEYIQKLDEAKIMQNQQFNIESQMASNQQAAQNEQATIQQEETMKANREAQNIQIKGQMDLLLEQQKGQNERKLAAIQNTYGWSADQYNQKPRYN